MISSLRSAASYRADGGTSGPRRGRGSVFAAGVALSIAAAMAASGFAYAQAPADPVIAKVEGVEIHQSDLTIADEDVRGDNPGTDEASKREYLINYLTDLILIAKAAEAKKIPDSADFKARMAFARNKTLMEIMLVEQTKSAVTDEALHKIYEEAMKQQGGQQQVHARHILFRVADPNDKAASKAAEDKVKAVIVRIKKGEDFVALANSMTEDPSGKQNGGDLGYFTRETMVPEFAEVAFKMQTGQVSDPVKTQFGWHVIKVEDKRDGPPFDQVREEIETYASRKAQVDYVNKLRQTAKIERLDTPAAPAAAPAPAAPKK